MDRKTIKELGFSMNELDANTVLIEGVVQGNVSKKRKVKYERNFSKVSLHLFDRQYVEKFQQVEVEIVNSEKSIMDRVTATILKTTKILLK